MGADISLAVLSDRHADALQLLQAALRAGHQPADRPDPRGHRDEHRRRPGRRGQPARGGPDARPPAVLDQPILRNHELQTLRTSPTTSSSRARSTSPGRSREGPDGLEPAPRRASARRPHEAVATGQNIIILSDRSGRPGSRPDPVAAGGRGGPPPPRARGHAPAHRASRSSPARHARCTTSRRCRLRRLRREPVDDVRDGRRAVDEGVLDQTVGVDRDEAEIRVRKAIGKGLLKTISKMGISTIQSYCGAQIFEAVGLARLARRPPLHRHRLADRRDHDRRAGPGDARAPPARLPGVGRRPAAGRRRLLCGGATASTTCGTRTRSRCSSTPFAQRRRRRPTSSSPGSRRGRDAAGDAARAARDPRRRRTPVALEEVEPCDPRSSSAS